MNKLHLIGLAAAALTCVSAAFAQEDAPSGKLRAYVQLPNEKPTEMALEGGDGKGSFMYLQKGTDQQLAMPAASCKLFFIQTPNDLVTALASLREGDLPAARKQMAAVKQKYAAYAGLPTSPVSTAAVGEITAAVRMLDFAAIPGLVSSIPSPESLTNAEQARVKAASIMGAISDSPKSLETQKAAITELLKDKKLAKCVTTELYAWLRYALGRAYLAQIPADSRAAIPEAQLKNANDAIDNFCQAAVATHGIAPEIPADAMGRAIELLWAMPGVQEYAKKANAANMTAPVWNAAPADFRDAVVMSKLLKTVYACDSVKNPEIVDKLAGYYFNAAESKAAAEKPAEPAK